MSTSIKYNDVLYTTGNNISFSKENINKSGNIKYVVHVYNSDVHNFDLEYNTESERDHVIETITRCLGGYLDLDDIDNSKEKGSGGGGSSQGIFVGYVNGNVTVPTTRPDGSDLKDEDYVRSNSTTYPFTTLPPNSITFPNKLTTKAYYSTITGTFIVDVGAIQDTSETPLKSESESFSGTKTLQNEVNLEVVDELKQTIKQYKVLPSNYTQFNGAIGLYIGATTTEYEQYQYYRCDGTGWNKFNIVAIKSVKIENLDTSLSSRIYEVTLDASDPNVLVLKSLS